MGKFNKEEILQFLENDLKFYKHSIQGKVRFDEIDSFGVVHNVKYFYWLEWARMEYFEALGAEINQSDMINKYPFMVVHSDIDYFSPCSFNDIYEVHSKISFIKESTLGFDNIIKIKDGPIVAKASSVLVYLDINTNKTGIIPDELKNLISE